MSENQMAVWKDPYSPKRARRYSFKRGHAFVGGLTAGLLTVALVPLSTSTDADVKTPAIHEIEFCLDAAEEAGVELAEVTTDSEDSIHALRCFDSEGEIFGGRTVYATPVVE